jgi:glutamate-1-semialdehyde 2,1-aminomutase
VASGAPVVVNRVGSMLTPFFAPGPVTDYASATASDTAAYGAFARALLAEGVYPPPSQFEAWFTGLAHTAADLAHLRAALARAAQAPHA